MTKEGIVTRIDGECATVLVKVHNACDSCRAECGGHCDKAKLEKVCVKNTLNAHTGDRVLLYSNTQTIMLWAVLVFVLPIVLTFITGVVTFVKTSSTLWCTLVSVITFFATFLVLKFVFRDKKDSDVFVIKEIIKGDLDNENY